MDNILKAIAGEDLLMGDFAYLNKEGLCFGVTKKQFPIPISDMRCVIENVLKGEEAKLAHNGTVFEVSL